MNRSTNNAFEKLIQKSSSAEASYDRKAAIVRVAHFIRSLRNKANLSQSELGTLINQEQSAISRWESYDNKNMPNLESLILITHACGQRLKMNTESFASPVNTSIPEKEFEVEVGVGVNDLEVTF